MQTDEERYETYRRWITECTGKDKPYKGVIKNWYRQWDGEFFAIAGVRNDTTYTVTSLVISLDTKTGFVETLNSRYCVIGDEVSNPEARRR